MIHSTAIIDPTARVASDVRIGPYCVVGPDVVIGRGTVLESHVVVECNTRIGEECQISSFASLGSDPQDLGFKGQPTYAVIGDRNRIREYVTINRGAHGEAVTRVGNDNLLMTGVHIAHDCRIGSNCIMANMATFGGHCEVGDRAVIGGLAAFHQFVRVGNLAMVGGMGTVLQDIPPYCLAIGTRPVMLRGLNMIGLQRNGVGPDGQKALKQAFRMVFLRGMTRENAIEEVKESVAQTPEVGEFLRFMAVDSKRGYSSTAQKKNTSKLRVVGEDDEPKSV